MNFNDNVNKKKIIFITTLVFIIFIVLIIILNKNNNISNNQTENDEMDVVCNYNNPIVPQGFKKIETETASWETDEQGNPKGWNDGLVIEDGNGNQFVWVPCTIEGENNTTKYSRYIIYNDILVPEIDDKLYPSKINQNKSWYFIEDNLINQNILDSVKEYQGFYIGRYETGIEDGVLLPITNNYTETSYSAWQNGRAIVKGNSKVWNYITREKAEEISKNFISSNEIQSQLITSYCFDTTMKWISNDISDFVINSQKYGNYDEYEKDKFGHIFTGTNDKYMYKNIYDIAGNMREYTTENQINDNDSSNEVVIRENYNLQFDTDNLKSCFSRNGMPKEWYNISCSFRIILFIKNIK